MKDPVGKRHGHQMIVLSDGSGLLFRETVRVAIGVCYDPDVAAPVELQSGPQEVSFKEGKA